VRFPLSRPGRWLPPIFLALSLLTAGSSAARAGAQSDATDASGGAGFTVRGAVVNRVTGQPIARALVEMGEFATLTGADGQFTLEHVPAGRYEASARKPGYLGFPRRIVRGNILMIDPAIGRTPVQVGTETPEVTLRLTPAAVLAGQVTLSTADPADGIQVIVYRREMQNGRPRWSQAGFATTRSDGSFRVADLQPGSYLVHTQAVMDHPGLAPSSGAPVRGFPAVYYPGVTDSSAAGILSVGPGQHVEADLTLTLRRYFPVTVAVQSSEPAPINFEIVDSRGRSTGLGVQYDSQLHVLRSAVPNGAWSLLAVAFGNVRSWGRLDFQVSGAPVRASIDIVPVPRIPVLIRRDYTPPANSAPDVSPGLSLMLTSKDGIGSDGYLSNAGGPGGRHSWILELDRPGVYRAETNTSAPVYVSEISSGGVDLRSEPLTILPGSSVAPIEVTLRNDAGTIAGRVKSGSAAASIPGEQPRAWVYAIPLFPTTAGLTSTTSDAGGEFSIADLAPGSYRVIACDAPQEIDLDTPEGLARWSGRGQTVTVEAGATASVDLDRIATEAQP
jgi:hypothetical protein